MLPGIHDFLLFVVAGILLNLTPGPDTLYVIARSAGQGLRAGIVGALGIGSGCFVHIFAVALGLSALLAASATAFVAVRLLGAVYLIFLGATLLRGARGSADRATASELPQSTSGAPASMGLGRVYAQGFLTNALNPKVALFFLAFLPQFVDAAAPHKALALLLLGLVFDVNGTLWLLLVAVMTVHATRYATRLRVYAHWRDRAIGALFVVFGLRLAAPG